MKIFLIFHCPLMSRTLVRLPVSNRILSFSKKLGGRCSGNSAPEQPRTLSSMPSLFSQTLSFTFGCEKSFSRNRPRIPLQTSSRILPVGMLAWTKGLGGAIRKIDARSPERLNFRNRRGWKPSLWRGDFITKMPQHAPPCRRGASLGVCCPFIKLLPEFRF
jgi:hypothetical protein